MGHITIKPKFHLVLWVTLLVALPASAARGEGYLFGLGLHEETGRNIYLGGIYLDDGAARPTELKNMPDPWVMEYRIVARRTSIRSLLGGMLLQSEVATGRSPGPATIAFADNILSNVKSSLYAGDALEVQLKNNVTYAALNGQRLARSSNPEVAAYILAGWVSENGPSNAFRKELIASEINPELLEQYNSTRYSPQRKAEVASWLGSPPAGDAFPVQAPATDHSVNAAQQGAPAATESPPAATTPDDKPGAEFQSQLPPSKPGPGSSPDSSPAAITDSAPTADPTAALQTGIAQTPDSANPAPGAIAGTAAMPTVKFEGESESENAAIDTGPPPGGAAAPPIPLISDPAEQAPVDSAELATLIRDAELPESGVAVTPGAVKDTVKENDARSLGVQEYSQRLASFHSQMIARVYGEIRYPKRAVRRNLQGRLELDVSFSHDGTLLNVEVALSSGHKMLDEAATSAAHDAFKKQLEAIDTVAVEEFGTQDDRLIVPIPVQFRLQ